MGEQAFFSWFFTKNIASLKIITTFATAIQKAQVAELVDAHVSGACAARREGSSPFLGTAKSDNRLIFNDCRAFLL